MAMMAVKSSLVCPATPSPECWSSCSAWEPDPLPTPDSSSSWEWATDPHGSSSSLSRPIPSSCSEWASVTIASASTKSTTDDDDDSSPAVLYAFGVTSATSVSSGIPGVARSSDSSPLVKHEPSLFFRSLSRDSDESSPSLQQQQQKSNDSNTSSEEGVTVGLKLGRRTYLVEDASGKPGPGKKPRGPLSPPNSNGPRCQVEGCLADLSGCKDYHKRHKVCEIHSKAPKAIAGGIEQRFCQQCSRFHILKEFDEGKRSCRRRLEGHNQRRRKPHPETHSLFGMGNPYLHREISTSTLGGAPYYFSEDIKPSTVLHPHRGLLLDYGLHSYGLNRANPWSFKSRNDSIPTFQMQNPKTPMTTLKPTPGLSLGGHHHFLEGSLGPLDQSLSLSSSTGGLLGNLDPHQHQRSHSLSNVSGMMDSGRALSLLSSQSWAPRPPLTTTATSPAAAAISAQQPVGDSTLEHLVASSNESGSRGGSGSGASRFAHLLPREGSSATTSAHHFSMQTVDSGGLSFGPTATGTCVTGTHEQQRGGYNINNNNNMLAGFGVDDDTTNSMLAMVHQSHQGHDQHGGFGGGGSAHNQQARATMDLMQTVHNNRSVHSQQPVYGTGLSSFESSRFSDRLLL